MFIIRMPSAGPPAGDDFWFEPVAPSVNGYIVGPDAAMRLSTVYKCVRVRAETIGMLPLKVYQRIDGGGKKDASDHPLSALLHDQPNPWQTAMQWRSMMQSHIDLRGNAFSEVVFGPSGRVDMLVPMHPDCVRIEVMPSGRPRYRYKPPQGDERVLMAGEVLHLMGLSTDGYCGLNPIEAQREALSAAMASRDFGTAFFKNQARPPMWIKYPGKFSKPEDKRAWVEEFSRKFGGLGSGKVPVMEQGMEISSIPINNADAQFIETRKFQDIDIAGLFRVPPHKIGILDRATWANIEHQQLDFVTDCVLPTAVAWEQTLLRDLPFGDGFFAEFKVDMLLRADTKTRYEAYGRAILDGWMLRNEAREHENMNRIEGLDKPLMPLNMATVGPNGSVESTPQPDAPPTQPPGGP